MQKFTLPVKQCLEKDETLILCVNNCQLQLQSGGAIKPMFRFSINPIRARGASPRPPRMSRHKVIFN